MQQEAEKLLLKCIILRVCIYIVFILALFRCTAKQVFVARLSHPRALARQSCVGSRHLAADPPPPERIFHALSQGMKGAA